MSTTRTAAINAKSEHMVCSSLWIGIGICVLGAIVTLSMYGPYSEIHKFKHDYVPATCYAGANYYSWTTQSSMAWWNMWSGINAYVNVFNTTIHVQNIKLRYPSTTFAVANTYSRNDAFFSNTYNIYKNGNFSCILPKSLSGTGILFISYEYRLTYGFWIGIGITCIGALCMLSGCIISLFYYVFQSYLDALSRRPIMLQSNDRKMAITDPPVYSLIALSEVNSVA